MSKIMLLVIMLMTLCLAACNHADNNIDDALPEVIPPTVMANEPISTTEPEVITETITETVLVPEPEATPEQALSPSGKPWFNEDPLQRGVFWLGMTTEEAAQAFEENGLVATRVDGFDNILATNHVQEVQYLTFNKKDKLVFFFVMVRPHFFEEYTGDINMYTQKGIGLGDSFEKVEALYGSPDRIENADDRRSVIYSYLIDEESKYYLLFTANGLPDEVDAFMYNVCDDTMYREAEEPENLLTWGLVYGDDGIIESKEYIFPNGEKRLYEPGEYILWLGDNFVSAKVYELPTGVYDMELWIPLSALPKLETYIANGTEYTGRTQEMDGITLVESAEAAEAMGMGVAMHPGWGERSKIEYPDYDFGSVGYERSFTFAPNPILFFGTERPRGEYPPNYEAVLSSLKDNMNQAYAVLENIVDNNEANITQLEKLRQRIDTTDFVAQYDKYFVFAGPYNMLWDNVTENVYFYTFTQGSGCIWKADFTDPELFVPMYFAD